MKISILKQSFMNAAKCVLLLQRCFYCLLLLSPNRPDNPPLKLAVVWGSGSTKACLFGYQSNCPLERISLQQISMTLFFPLFFILNFLHYFTVGFSPFLRLRKHLTYFKPQLFHYCSGYFSVSSLPLFPGCESMMHLSQWRGKLCVLDLVCSRDSKIK